MKRHPTAPAIRIGTRNNGGRAGREDLPARTAIDGGREQARAGEPRLVLAAVCTRTHTLVLTGELDRRSAHTLEAEIERLCDGGVTGITLDLRQLTRIDSIGVAVIAFRSRLCRRRGYDFAVIPGSRLIHRVLARAGVAELLAVEQDEDTARAAPGGPSTRTGAPS